MKTTESSEKWGDFQSHLPSAEAGRRDYDPSDSAETLSGRRVILSRVCRLIAAGIMLETLYFKFTGQSESIWIFTQMNMEPWWRYGQGIWELFASVLLFVPGLIWMGALLTLAAMGAAILSHLSVLGIAIQGDHGVLFSMACTTFVSALAALWIHQQSVPHISRLDDFPER